jgi:hypothetical protein
MLSVYKKWGEKFMLTLFALIWLFLSNSLGIDFYSFLAIIVALRVIFAKNKKQLFNQVKITKTEKVSETLDELGVALVFIGVSVIDYAGIIGFVIQLLMIMVIYRLFLFGTNALLREHFSSKGKEN